MSGTDAATAHGRKTRLRLPPSVHACLFDLDGVLTDTATVHAEAWKATFDRLLQRRALTDGVAFVAFDPVRDYDEYVDGRPREDGVRAFLGSRGIHLPEGDGQDSPRAETIHGIANRKNALVLELIHRNGVVPFLGSVRFVRAARAAGLPCGVVSASANCCEVLEAAGLASLFDVRVDGVVAAARHLRGKPAPDTYREAARMLGVAPANAAVFEDALAGVAAARAGGFGYIVGVDRVGQEDALRARGADVVVHDLGELLR